MQHFYITLKLRNDILLILENRNVFSKFQIKKNKTTLLLEAGVDITNFKT